MQFHLQSSQSRWTKQALSKTTYMINYKKRNKWQSYPAGWAVFHQCTENYIKSKQTPEIHEYLKGNFAIKCRGAFWNFKRPDFKKQKCVFGWNQKDRTEVSHSYPNHTFPRLSKLTLIGPSRSMSSLSVKGLIREAVERSHYSVRLWKCVAYTLRALFLMEKRSKLVIAKSFSTA